ncbi:M20 peptidase aminoacylase family protein [Sulfurospirillum barnesii]|uniref:Amidohydrolase n=1 Tax=Sulfurospirillum barnesii (strain ATCC 700032 / DSM 10660 / SES-3) TaxID=760154 RepID=I3Y033_SULBS|nr:M20 peptidase aminoacylase family protein [Sulfurospirillum barnesii]AFL69557.1 amidohydrolase [Sulfurospirillum barnesii SES-3]
MSRVIEVYDYLHTIPELGFQEYKTAAFLAQELQKAGFHVTTNVGETTGVVGVYDSGVEGSTLALRADIDALGHIIDGQPCAMHTCGHDAHSAMVLAAAEELLANQCIKKGKLKIIFQPAEEIGTGALAMINGGAIDDVDMILGLHLRPLEETSMGKATPALYHAASQRLKGVFHGVSAHGARPHLGINAIDAAVAAITAVNAIHLNPTQSYSIKATQIIADAGVTNAIPNEATVIWDVRSEFNSTMDSLLEKAKSAIIAGAATVGASVDVTNYFAIPAAEYSDEAIDVLTKAIVEVYGEEGLCPPIKTAGGEDFHYYIKEKPSIKAGYFGLGCDLTPGLHHPQMAFNKNALEHGKDILMLAAQKVLNA